MPKFDVEKARLCPFKKDKTITYDVAGPDYTPVPVTEVESFSICIGEDCMLYDYNPHLDTEYCMLGWNPYGRR